jgi:hypothetical protein
MTRNRTGEWLALLVALAIAMALWMQAEIGDRYFHDQCVATGGFIDSDLGGACVHLNR